MLERLTLADFTPLVGSAIPLALDDGGTLPLVLEKASDLSRGSVEKGRRAAFSVWFVGPAEPVLPQRMYALECGPLGRLEIFIVPIGRLKEGGIRYEAVFN